MSFYILHAALILAGCFTFYKLLLQKETFFRLNRAVFIGCIIFSFALPLLPVPQAWSFRQAAPENRTIANVPVEAEEVIPAETLASTGGSALQNNPGVVAALESEKIFKGVMWLYWFGVGVLGLNFLVQLVLLLYRTYTGPVIRDGRFRIVEMDGDKAPCSFGNTIFINPAKYDWETYSGILAHEKVHIRQGHTFDLLLAEVMLVFQWFNPFAWLYRRELEHNLEFLADDQLIQAATVEPATYQMSLLKVSAPHFPLSLTTNYNQSLLKKRLIMMNAKKSNINTTWKYLFIFPLLALFVSLLNKPMAAAQEVGAKQGKEPVGKAHHPLKTEGAWFATIKEDKVSIQFKNDDNDGSNNSTTFTLSELGTLPRSASGNFSVVRDAGAIVFTGKFEGNGGMGRYQFTRDEAFADLLQKGGVKETGEEDMMVYFLVNVNRAFYAMLKAAGYNDVQKDELIPLAALKVDGAFIKSLKEAGFRDISVGDLIPLKALGVDAAYVGEIRKAGYPNITPQQIITFKAQGIDGKYIADVRQSSAKAVAAPASANNEYTRELVRETEIVDEELHESSDDDELNNIVAYKAMQIDAAYIESLKSAGYPNLSRGQLISMKANGIDAAYIQTVAAMGYRNVSPSNLVAMKAQGITQDFVRSFESVGFTKIAVSDLIPLRALGVNAAFIKGFQDAGYPKLTLQNAIALKAHGIAPSLVKQYKDLGFEQL